MKKPEVTKAVGIDKISGELLKYGARNLAKPIGELNNLSMTIIHKCLSMTNSQR